MNETGYADISVLIVAYRSRDTIGRCLAALEAQSVRPREVLLLENGSPPGEAVQAADLPDWVRFINAGANLGFAAGNNRLAAAASGAWLALLNPDAYAHGDWIEQLDRATRDYPDIALFGSTQYSADRPDFLDGVGDVYHAAGLAYRAGYQRPVSLRPGDGEVFGPCAAAALVRKTVFDELGGFDERFFCYNEDVDFAFRARLAGHRTVQLSAAAVDHAGYASSGRRSEFATYYGVRNREWVFFKNMPLGLLLLLTPLHALATLALWLSSARFGQFTLYGRALRDASKAWPEIMRSRREIQSRRVASHWKIARAMSWNPLNLVTRRPVIRPCRPAGFSTPELPVP